MFAHSTCVKGTTKAIIGAVVFIKATEDLAREKGECKTVEVESEFVYMENLAQAKVGGGDGSGGEGGG